MTDPVNAAQRALWNAQPGATWVTHQAVLDRMHQPMADLLLEAARPAPGEQVLDIGCGAGQTVLMAAAMVGPSGRVLGLDISAPLLDLARHRIAGAALPGAEVLLADAQTWPGDGTTVDLVISRMGVMFFEDPVAAFANIRRRMRPGGRLVFICWAEGNPWFDLPAAACAAHFGPPEAPEDPGAPGPLAFRDPERVCRLLTEAGFANAATRLLRPVLTPGLTLEETLALCERLGPIAGQMRAHGGSPADLEAILARLRPEFAAFEEHSEMRIPARMHLCSARA
ncbi:class I SAM-dependent methyltransferase [Pseudooceanicola sp. CBS1P-1]|uniref:Methyltransferase domain-containing protein n=1 Tax=Pseudooceanicola albus TaxID=2692189 RepID=A0A6L7G400_9RHOB|nr:MULTISPECIES: class I SAM-dependent methyltransferase [Pseudooceanicola]MBT9384535.1 class I SAM-dependent methyltransferase [Pseudooceanicola endophyticus]MXN18237.1 methyltransferase domain-containing protein [Pseudooceanicola albus]